MDMEDNYKYMHHPKGGHWTVDTKNNYATVTFVYIFVETFC